MRQCFRPGGFVVILCIAGCGAGDVPEPAAAEDPVPIPEMIELPGGRFLMGSTPAETEAHGVREHHAVVEWPQHDVVIDTPFAIGRYEVTVAEYRAFAEATGRPASACLVFEDGQYHERAEVTWLEPGFEQGDDHPVICVDWNDAVAYADWLSEQTGRRFRLPSEAEWEYAARGGTTGARYWNAADGDACAHANVADQSSPRPQFDCSDPYPATSPVDYGIPNDFGLYNVLGNVGELVADCGLPDYASASGTQAAVTDGDCEKHVGRGGSWWNDAYYLRAARRYSFSGAYRIVGFRVVAEIRDDG